MKCVAEVFKRLGQSPTHADLLLVECSRTFVCHSLMLLMDCLVVASDCSGIKAGALPRSQKKPLIFLFFLGILYLFLSFA